MGGDRRGALVRRGEVRGLILAALRDKPMHGYQVIQELEAQTEGRWRPSAGSIYPTLQLLADEGLVIGEDVDGRRVYSITEAGRKLAAESGDRSPWTQHGEPTGPDIRGLASAALQVHRIGSPRARREAMRIVSEARRELYRLLSEDEERSADDSAEGSTQV
jgi:DNA-binding PadR family transcriptional regulator